jgi:hypothetical protein
LLRFPAIGFLRVLLGTTNKKGERPVVKWNNAVVTSPRENEIVINAENDEAFRIVEQVGPVVHGKLKFTSGGPVSVARYRKMARALWKATLECVYLDHGEMVYEPRFDEVREMIIGSRPASGFVLFPREGPAPTTEIALTYQFVNTDHGVVLVSLTTIAGVQFFTELLDRQFRGDRAEVGAVMNIIEF